MSSSNNASNGVGLLGLVFVAFLVLKLSNVIHWSWWWVTAPLWGGFALVILIVLIAVAWFCIGSFIHHQKNKK